MREVPKKIYNANETGLHLTNRPGHVPWKKGKISVISVTSTYKGKTVTIMGCCSAAANYIPPHVIKKGVWRKPEFCDDLPSGSVLAMSDTGYINTELFFGLAGTILQKCPAW